MPVPRMGMRPYKKILPVHLTHRTNNKKTSVEPVKNRLNAGFAF
jgi:hypothetical protein